MIVFHGNFCNDIYISVVIIVGPKEDRRNFLLTAFDLGMTSGEYVFYTMDMLPDKEILGAEDVWASNDDLRNNDARIAFEAVFHVRLL